MPDLKLKLTHLTLRITRDDQEYEVIGATTFRLEDEEATVIAYADETGWCIDLDPYDSWRRCLYAEGCDVGADAERWVSEALRIGEAMIASELARLELEVSPASVEAYILGEKLGPRSRIDEAALRRSRPSIVGEPAPAEGAAR